MWWKISEMYKLRVHMEKKIRIFLHIQISECKLCGETFQEMYKLRVHMKKRNNRFPFPSSYLNVNYAVKHLKICINYESTWRKEKTDKKKQISLLIQIFECKLCGGTFKQMYKLRVHMEKRKNRFPFTSKCLNVNNVVIPLKVHVAKCMSLFIKLFECKHE